MNLWFRRERPLTTLIAAAIIIVGFTVLMRPVRRWHSHQTAIQTFRPAIEVPGYFVEWRNAFLAANTDTDTRGLVRGIFLGSTALISDKETVLFRRAGLSHLLAASGFNCWIVAMAFGLIGKFLVAAFSRFLPSPTLLATRSRATALSRIAGAWLFWLWTDQSPPITRSVLAISAQFVFEFSGLSVPFSRLLLVQYLVSLVVLPRLWCSASFQLTFGCLFGILYFPALIARWKPTGHGWATALWNYLATSMGACLGTIPTTAIVFGTINFSSLVTNWFAVPIVSLGVMPAALVQMLLIPARGSPAIDTAIHLSGWVAAKTCDGLHFLLMLWAAHFPALSYPPTPFA